MAFVLVLALWTALSPFTLALTSQVTPLESRPTVPRPGGCVNGPKSRGCWKGDFDIYTDYDTKIPQGRVREVSNLQFSPLFLDTGRITDTRFLVPSHGHRKGNCCGWISREQDCLQWCVQLLGEGPEISSLLTTITGQYPGPLIEADWGDTLRTSPPQ